MSLTTYIDSAAAAGKAHNQTHPSLFKTPAGSVGVGVGIVYSLVIHTVVDEEQK